MVSSQPQRSGPVQAWWAHTGSTNRGFVSLDPERQREVESGRPAAKKPRAEAFRFDVPPQRRGRPARKAAGPADGGTPPAGADASRR